MKVAELIEMLEQLDQEKNIMVKDTAAGFREVADIENALGYQYIICTEKPKRGKGK